MADDPDDERPLDESEQEPSVSSAPQTLAAPSPRARLTRALPGRVPAQGALRSVGLTRTEPWSQDPATRAGEAVQTLEDTARAHYEKKDPYRPSGWNPKMPRSFVVGAVNEADHQASQQAQVARQQAQADVNAYNSKALAKFKTSGQQYYTDPATKRLVPVVDEAGKSLYHTTPWEEGKDPKSGEPTFMRRNQHGEKEYKTPQVVASPDLTDDQLYYKFGDNDLRPAGRVEDLVKHPNFNIARTAQRTAAKRRTAMWKEAIAPMEQVAANATAEFDMAKQRHDELAASAEQIQAQLDAIDSNPQLQQTQGGFMGIGSSPSDQSMQLTASREALMSQLQQIQVQQQQLAEDVKPTGKLARTQRQAKLDLAIFKAKAGHDNYADLAEERRMILKQQGKSEKDDPTLQSILQAQETYNAAISKFATTVQRDAAGNAVAAPTQQQAPAGASAPQAQGEEPSAAAGGEFEPAQLAAKGVKDVGGVSVQDIARRFGSGTGEVRPDQLIQIKKRIDEVKQTLENKDTMIGGEGRDSLQKQSDYLLGLFNQRFAKLPPDVQRRVQDATRDPTFFEKYVRSPVVAAARGAGTGIVDIAETAARRGPDLLLPGLSALTPDSVREAQTEGANAMREAAQGWTESSSPEVAAKLREGTMTGTIPEAVGGALPFVAGGELPGALGKAVGLSERAIAALARTGTAATGAAQGGNAMRREAIASLKPQLDSGQITKDEYERALGYSELAGSAVGAAAMAPFTKIASRLGQFKSGQTFLSKFLQQAAKGGSNRAIKWLTTEGKSAVADVVREAGVGAATGFAQTLANDAAAKGIYDPKREVSLNKAGEGAGQMGLVTALISAFSHGAAPKGPSARETAEAEFQKRLQGEEPAKPTPQDEFQARGQPSTAEEAAQVLAQPPAKSAEESAKAIEQGLSEKEGEAASSAASDQRTEANKEGRIQTLIDELSNGDDVKRQLIMARRQGVNTDDFLEALEGAADYRRNPAGQPDVLAKDVSDAGRREGAKPITAETPGVQMAGQEPPAELAAGASRPMPASAEEAAAGHAGATADEIAGRRMMGNPNQDFSSPLVRGEPKPRVFKQTEGPDISLEPTAGEQVKQTLRNLEAPRDQPITAEQAQTGEAQGQADRAASTQERAQAIDTGLTKEEQLRQSPAGADKLREQLGKESGRPPEEPGAAAAVKPAPEPKTPAPALKPLPKDTEFLYEQGGHRYFQVDRSAENPRGRTVDERTLKQEGFDTAGLPTEKPAAPAADVAKDRAEYDRLQAEMKKLGPKQAGTPEFNAIWKQSEVIKNRHGGMPPGEVAGPAVTGSVKPKTEETSHATPVREQPANDQLQHPGATQGKDVRENRGQVREEKGAKAVSSDRAERSPEVGRQAEGARPVRKVNPEKAPAPVSAHVTESTPASVEGEKISKQWTGFDKNSGTLGIPRNEMPQIKSEARGALVNFLKARGIGAKSGMINPTKLKPTQAEFSPEKVDKARKHDGPERPILISGDNHVVDGHHQWMAALDDKETPMPVIRLDAPIDRVLADMKEFPSTETAKGSTPAAKAEKPVPVSTPSLSERAIRFLENAKTSKPGQVTSHTPLSLAYDSALDLAILGIKAGRAVNDVVKLAVQRFKAKYPDATEADVQRLTSEINDAHAEPTAANAGLAKRLGEQWKNFKSEGDLKNVIAANRDAVEGKANQFAVEATNEVRDALLRAEPDKAAAKTADNALRFYIESGDGDKGRLENMRKTLEASDKAPEKWKAKALEAIDYAEKNGDKLKDAATRYRRIMKEQLGIEQQSGFHTLEREDYVPRHQDMEDDSWLFASKESSTGASSRKNRTFETQADSIAAGRDPKTLSAIDSLTARTKSGMQGVNLHAWQRALFDMKTPDGKAAIAQPAKRVERANGSHYFETPKGYSLETIGNTPVAIHNDYSGLVGALTDPSWFQQHKALLAVQKANATAKSVTLAVDTFHLGRLALRSATIRGSKPLEGKIGPAYREGLMLADHSAAEISRMAESGEIPKKDLPRFLEAKKDLDDLVKVGYNIGRVADAMHQELVQKVPFLGDVNKFIFQKFQRGAMSDAGVLEFQRQLKDNPNMSREEVARKVSRELMTRFGNLGRQGGIGDWMKSQTGQDMMRMMFLAPQWNEGLIRSELGGVKQIGQYALDKVQGKKTAMGLLGREMITTAVSLFAASQIINQVTRGKWTWENPEEGFGAKLSAWIPDKVGGSSGFFLNPMGLTAETAHLLMNSFERSGNASDPVKDYLRSRASAVTKPLWTYFTGKDVLGRTIKKEDLYRESAKDAIPAPISGGSAVRGLKGLATGGKTEQYPGEFQKQIMQSAGVRTDKAPSPEQRMAHLAHDFNQGKGKSYGGSGEISDYEPFTAALRRDNPDDVKDAIDTLLQHHSADALEKYYKAWSNRPFTGSHAGELEFLRSLNNEQRAAYNKARAERRRLGALALRAIQQIPASKREGPMGTAAR